MLSATIESQVAGLHIQLQDADYRIDRALDRGSRREFMVWAKRRSSLASRLQNLLLRVASEP
jgi:hypothetical protein